MLRKVKLYGALKDFVGHSDLEAHVNSPAEAVRFLLCNWPQLESHMSTQTYKVLVGKDELIADELHYPAGMEPIKIVPVVTGAGGNTGKIILGAALIGASFLFPGAGMFGTTSVFGVGAAGSSAAVTGSVFMTAAGTMISSVGAALVLHGVSGLLNPLPEIPEYQTEADPRLSFSFSGVQNTSRAGTPIPICYGEVITGSIQISLGVDTEQVRA